MAEVSPSRHCFSFEKIIYSAPVENDLSPVLNSQAETSLCLSMHVLSDMMGRKNIEDVCVMNESYRCPSNTRVGMNIMDNEDLNS